MLVFKEVDILKGNLKLTGALEASGFLEVKRLKVNFLVWDFLGFIVQQFERKEKYIH